MTDSVYERSAALYRAIGSNQLLLEGISTKCAESRKAAENEYYALKSYCLDMAKNPDDLTVDRSKLRTALLRLKELRRVMVAMDEISDGAKYHVDSEHNVDDKSQDRTRSFAQA